MSDVPLRTPTRAAAHESLRRDWQLLVGMALAVALLAIAARVGSTPPASTTGVKASTDLAQYERALQPGGPRSLNEAAAPARAPVTVTGTRASARVGTADVTVTGTSHKPSSGRPWSLAFRANAPVAGKVDLTILFGGTVVGHLGTHELRGGAYVQRVSWPQVAAGEPLTVSAAVTCAGATRTFLFAVEVAR